MVARKRTDEEEELGNGMVGREGNDGGECYRPAVERDAGTTGDGDTGKPAGHVREHVLR